MEEEKRLESLEDLAKNLLDILAGDIKSWSVRAESLVFWQKDGQINVGEGTEYIWNAASRCADLLHLNLADEVVAISALMWPQYFGRRDKDNGIHEAIRNMNSHLENWDFYSSSLSSSQSQPLGVIVRQMTEYDDEEEDA